MSELRRKREGFFNKDQRTIARRGTEDLTSKKYLDDKTWILFRPTKTLDQTRLKNSVHIALQKASNPKKAYDYSGALGLVNVSTTPNTPAQIASEYTCVTLIQSALHYAGHPTKSTYRHGYLDIITPAQLIHSAIQ